MGYAVLHLEKAKGADSGMSAHIERTIQPKNADPTRTHLNRELIQFPDGVRNRTAAIQHRLNTAGLKRKIGKNQVQAIRVVLTGTHADMEQIEKNGRLDKWCQDNLDWLRKTYGADNVVSAVLHMDEETPHIHATIVPIVQTERKKQKKEQTAKKRYRAKAPAPRLCADEVMSRANLIRYQDTYAEQMATYGLQRGIKGSEAQHISTHEYYRSLIAQGEDLQANITHLLEEQEKARQVIAEAEQAKKDLARIKAEVKTEELKNSATKTAATALNGLNSLLGGNKVSRLEKENAQLHREVDELNGQIERLHSDMQKLKDNHARERNRAEEQHQQEVSNLKRILDKAYRWFPSFKRFLNMERECLACGFNMEQTDKLLYGHAVNYSGWLHSNEYRRNALADNVTAQVIRDEKRDLFLHINQTPIAQWFKEQFGMEQEQQRGIIH
ncbi:MAG: plasmid recombination protein [Prevotella sp.]|nr:plasmid recombination protein [Prevotella sp.]MBP3777211.1 plasmid recombination protein [Prevotella sp.]